MSSTKGGSAGIPMAIDIFHIFLSIACILGTSYLCIYSYRGAQVAQQWERSPLATMVSGSIPGTGIICELSLLVLSCASRVFLRVLRFSSLHKNQPWFDLGCAPWPDRSRMVAARGALVCLWLGHVELRPCNSATRLQGGMISQLQFIYLFIYLFIYIYCCGCRTLCQKTSSGPRCGQSFMLPDIARTPPAGARHW